MSRALVVLVAACSGSSSHPDGPILPPRDWTQHRAIVDVPAASTIYAVGDVHGGYDRLAALLSRAGIADAAMTWTAADAVLVVTGDLIDKGPQGLEVIDAVIALQASAAAAGGRVVVTAGNHEAELLADPLNSKATATDGLDVELRAASIDPAAFVVADPRGVWLRELPFGARVGRWFFSHAGYTAGRSFADLDAALQADVDAHGYAGAETTGPDSILEARDWFQAHDPLAAATALDVDRVVFGHDPHALGADGKIATGAGGVLFRIDCGMSPDVDFSHGEILRIRGATIEAIAANGEIRAL